MPISAWRLYRLVCYVVHQVASLRATHPYRKPAIARASAFLGYVPIMLIAYLDEFGHIGPYVSRDHPTVSYTHLTLPTKRIV